MKDILSSMFGGAAKKILGETLGQADKWNYDDKLFGMPVISGTNGPEASVDSVSSYSNYLLEPGEWVRIGEEISKDVAAGVSLDVAKQRALNRMSIRRGVEPQHPVPLAGDNTPNTRSGVPIPITSDELMNLPVENWSNHDVGIVHLAAIRMGYDTTKGRKMAEKVKSWYVHHVDKQLKGPDVSGAVNSSGGGPVHVDGYVRSQDGKNISVRVHTRSRPHAKIK